MVFDWGRGLDPSRFPKHCLTTSGLAARFSGSGVVLSHMNEGLNGLAKFEDDSPCIVWAN